MEPPDNQQPEHCCRIKDAGIYRHHGRAADFFGDVEKFAQPAVSTGNVDVAKFAQPAVSTGNVDVAKFAQPAVSTGNVDVAKFAQPAISTGNVDVAKFAQPAIPTGNVDVAKFAQPAISTDNLVALHFKYDQARRRFIEWAQNEIAVVPDFHKRILFSDEAHFCLNGYVKKQHCRIWSEANTQVYVETPLHPEKLTVWCALWAGGILLQKR
ncbi:hypothetical protein TNCV_1975541 [Trichonephila clavipes]|nr:hypothetical protein TNCV_1975541 [Trichonephila clavipes]